MMFVDVPLTMDCAGDQLLGILSKPEAPLPLGLVIVVGGPQYRVGSHRQFLLLAHRLAQAGHAVLRFDYRGMGDSGGSPRNFEAIDDDIAAAINALQAQCPQVRAVVLWGLCDGASASLLYAGRQHDRRVAGLCLLNPWVRSEASLARTTVKHYYGERLLQAEFWRKLWRGQLDWRRSLCSLRNNLLASRNRSPADAGTASGPASANAAAVSLMPFQSQMAVCLRHFPGQVLLVLSGNDYTAKEFLEYATTDTHWRGLLNRPGLQRFDLAQADHTFSSASWRNEVELAVVGWMATIKMPV